MWLTCLGTLSFISKRCLLPSAFFSKMTYTPVVIKYLLFILSVLCLNCNVSDRQAYFLVTLWIIPVSCVIVNSIGTEHRNAEIYELINFFIFLIIMCLANVKLITLAFNRHRIKTILKIISEDLTKDCNERQKECLSKASYYTRIFIIMYVFGGIAYETLMISDSIIGRDGIQLPFNDIGVMWRGNGVTPFVCNYIFQLVVLTASFIGSIANNGILILSLLHMGAGLDVLIDRINDINRTGVTKQLRKIWEQQLLLMGLRNEIKSMFAIQISVQYIMSIGVLCFSSFRLTGAAFKPMAPLVSTSIFEIYALCYVGQLIQTKSEAILHRLYAAPWLQFGLPDRRRLIVMSLVSARPLTIKATLVDLTLGTFAQVLKTSYSLYAVLRKVSQNDKGGWAEHT